MTSFAFASAVPLTMILPARSVALITSFPATVEITVVPGTTVSMLALLVFSTLRLPAVSIAVTRIVDVAVSAGTSDAAKTAVQTPLVTATVLVTTPQMTSTLAASVAVPETATPAAFSVALTMPSTPPVWLTTKLIGAVRSTSTLRVAVPLTLPFTSVCTAVIGRTAPSAVT